MYGAITSKNVSNKPLHGKKNLHFKFILSNFVYNTFTQVKTNT